MTPQLCPQPGVARRRDGYEDQLIQCESEAAASTLNRLMVDKAIALGTGDSLTPQERCLLMALCAHLHIEGVAAGKTAVWPGAARLCQLMGIGESTLRRLKGSLEEKGFLLRRYDQRNRPLHGGSLDLKPFLLKVPEILAAIGHTEDALRAAGERKAAERADIDPTMGAQVLDTERATRNPPIDISERSLIGDQEAEDADYEAHLPMTDASERADQLLPGVSTNPIKVAEELFGAKKAARLWDWAQKRRGVEAHLALAVAAKNPAIRNPEAWFGWYATTTVEVDLDGLAAAVPTEPAIQVPSDPVLSRLFDAFAARVGEGAASSYLSEAKLSDEGTHIVVNPANRIVARRLAERFADDLVEAGRDAGLGPVRLAAGPEG